jgi:hypothetical protein
MAQRKQQNTHDPRKSERDFLEQLKIAERNANEIDKLRKLPSTPEREAKIAALAIQAAYHIGKAETHQQYAGMRRPNGYGWGAFLGSLAGAVLGKGLLGWPGAFVGSIAGGYYGGERGLPSGRPSRKAAEWGAIGGALGPITSGIAARAATDSGKSPNPQAKPGHVLPTPIVGSKHTFVIDSIGTVLVNGNYAYRGSYDREGRMERGGLIATYANGKWTTYGLDAKQSAALEAKLAPSHLTRNRNRRLMK